MPEASFHYTAEQVYDFREVVQQSSAMEPRHSYDHPTVVIDQRGMRAYPSHQHAIIFMDYPEDDRDDLSDL